MAADASRPTAPWRIGIDVGGTFTDMVLRDEAGESHVFKAPTVPTDPSRGVLDVLQRAAGALAIEMDELLSHCNLMVHGSTIATNTMLEGKGAKVGLITTEGFRDSLEIRRGIRENQWDHRRPFPPVLVPRYLRAPVGERIGPDGAIETPLSTGDVDRAADLFAGEGVESVAIVLINSYANPVHERQIAKHLRTARGADSVSLSCEVAPIVGEYERSSTTVVNACLAPRVSRYLEALDKTLRERGLRAPLLLVQSNGGAMSLDQVADRPVNLVLSGPAAGVGALNLYKDRIGSDDLILMEIGGTSCDVTLMSAGEVAVSESLDIAGYHLATPAVEIHTVGAGGGTIAGVDEAGMLFVGPRGAGAAPGPACYGLGGRDPTVTDAELLLGRLRPGPYADGCVSLVRAPAEAAVVERIAQPLGLGVTEAASGIIRLLEQSLLHAVERISIERGHDPSRFTLVAAGGAGPMHASSVARKLRCRGVYVPRQAGAFCAIGMLHADVRRDYLKVFFADLDRVSGEDVAASFRELEASALAALASEGFDRDSRSLARWMQLRYRGQQWSIRVDAEAVPARDATRRRFEAAHQRMFGHIQPHGTIEITSVGLAGIGHIKPGRLTRVDPTHARARAAERRAVWFEQSDDFLDTDIFAGADLAPGAEVIGPALIEEATTTVVVGPGDRLRVDAFDNFIIDFPSSEAAP